MCTGKLLKPETHKACLRVHHLSGEPDSVGYGQGIYKVGEFCGHGGRQPGFSSEMWYLPHRDATIIVDVNREDELVPQRPSTFVLEDIIEILFPKYAVQGRESRTDRSNGIDRARVVGTSSQTSENTASTHSVG